RWCSRFTTSPEPAPAGGSAIRRFSNPRVVCTRRSPRPTTLPSRSTAICPETWTTLPPRAATTWLKPIPLNSSGGLRLSFCTAGPPSGAHPTPGRRRRAPGGDRADLPACRRRGGGGGATTFGRDVVEQVATAGEVEIETRRSNGRGVRTGMWVVVAGG